MKRKLTSYKKAFAVSSKRRLFEAHFNSKNLDMFESTKSKYLLDVQMYVLILGGLVGVKYG